MFQCIVDTAQFLFHCVRELQFVFAESDSRIAPGRQKNPNAVFLFSFFILLTFSLCLLQLCCGVRKRLPLRFTVRLWFDVSCSAFPQTERYAHPMQEPYFFFHHRSLLRHTCCKAGTSARRIQAQAASPPHRLTPHGGISLPCIPRDPPQGSSDTNPPWSNRCTAQW